MPNIDEILGKQPLSYSLVRVYIDIIFLLVKF